MPIDFTCECGQELRVKEDLGGKRAICPACRREFVVPTPKPREQVFPVLETAPVAFPPIRVEQDKPEHKASPQGARPWWKDPTIVFGWGTPILGLVAFLVYLAWAHLRTSSDQASPPTHGALRQSIAASAAPGVLTNSIGMKFVVIPAGEFVMGTGDDQRASDDEKPRHGVRITQPFYLAAHETTRGQFRRFVEETSYRTDTEQNGMGGHGWNEAKKEFERDLRCTWRNPGFDQTDDHPVVNVSWNDANAFADWLSQKEGKTYRLPTEAEWEYACRAGTTTLFWNGNDKEGLADVANVGDGTARAKFPDWRTAIAARDGYAFTAPVGSFGANAFRLFDMHGNVEEWCSDWLDEDYYKSSPVDDPAGPVQASRNERETLGKVARGGGWNWNISRNAQSIEEPSRNP